MSTHHPTRAPSFAPVWRYCAGAGRMCAEVESMRTPSERTELGTQSHEIAHKMLTTGLPPGETEGVDAEVLEGAMLFADTVNDRLIELRTEGYEVLIAESEIRLESARLDNYGTADYVIVAYKPNEPVLFDIIDYKFGHKYVSVVNNEQLFCYFDAVYDYARAETVLARAEPPENITRALDAGCLQVRFTIVQPYCYGRSKVRFSTLTLVQLNVLAANMIQAANRTRSNSDELTAGLHCSECDACYRCPAAMQYGANLLEFVEMVGEPEDLTGAQLVRVLNVLEQGAELLKTATDSYKNLIEHYLWNNVPVPGWHLGDAVSAPKWRDRETAKLLFDQFGVDPISQIKNPNQLAKSAGVSLAALSAFTEVTTTRKPMRGDDPIRTLLFGEQPNDTTNN